MYTTTITLQELIDRLTAMPEDARSLPVTWRSPATGNCYDVESSVKPHVQSLRIRTGGRGAKAKFAEKPYVVIE